VAVFESIEMLYNRMRLHAARGCDGLRWPGWGREAVCWMCLVDGERARSQRGDAPPVDTGWQFDYERLLFPSSARVHGRHHLGAFRRADGLDPGAWGIHTRSIDL
jgi:hypothetical protein